MAAADFIKKLAPGAQKVYKKYNVLASLVIAQGCLESGFGSSGLSQQANNLFGVKGTYNGKYVLMWTSEQDKKGNVTRIQAKFRKYPSYAESLADLGSLYTRLSRYKDVVGEKDYKKATAAVSKAGYATDINYATKLNSIIFTYKLTQYDTFDDVPDEPEPETPTKPSYPSKEYQGKDVELNDGLPSDIDFRQLHVSTKDGKELVEIVGAVLELQDDTTGKKSFTFTLMRTEDNGTEFDLLVPGNILYLDEKVYNHQKYYITDIELDQSRKNVLQKKVTANHVYTVLLVNDRVEEKISKKLKINEALDFALTGTPFQYVLKAKLSEFDEVDQDGFGEKNRVELMDQIVEDYEIELDVNNYVIYVHLNMGKVVDFTLDSRYNMPGFKMKINDQNTSTRAWGYGAEKKANKSDTKSTDTKTEDEKEKEPEYEFQPILYIHPDEDKFLIEGKPRWGEPIRDDTVKKASNMVSALKKHVNPYPDVVVEAEYQFIYEPALQGIEDDFWKGDTIHVIADTANGITFEDDVRLVSVTYNPLNPYDSPKMTFANFRKDIQDYQVSQARQIKQQKRYIDQLMRTLN